MFGVQRRQEESEGFKFTHCWDTSPWLAAENDAGLPQNPSELILASDRSELTHRTPHQAASSPAVRPELSTAAFLAL